MYRAKEAELSPPLFCVVRADMPGADPLAVDAECPVGGTTRQNNKGSEALAPERLPNAKIGLLTDQPNDQPLFLVGHP